MLLPVTLALKLNFFQRYQTNLVSNLLFGVGKGSVVRVVSPGQFKCGRHRVEMSGCSYPEESKSF